MLSDGLYYDSGPKAETEIDGLASDEVDSTSLSKQERLMGDGWMSDAWSKLPKEVASPPNILSAIGAIPPGGGHQPQKLKPKF